MIIGKAMVGGRPIMQKKKATTKANPRRPDPLLGWQHPLRSGRWRPILGLISRACVGASEADESFWPMSAVTFRNYNALLLRQDRLRRLARDRRKRLRLPGTNQLISPSGGLYPRSRFHRC